MERHYVDENVEASKLRRIFSIWDPTLKRRSTKTFSVKKWSEDEIDKLGAAWLAEQEAGIRSRRQAQAEETVNRNVETTRVARKVIEERTASLLDQRVDGLSFDGISIQQLKTILRGHDGTGITALLLGSSKSGKTVFLNKLQSVVFPDRPTVLFTPNLNSGSYEAMKASRHVAAGETFDPEVLAKMHKLNMTAKKNEVVAYPFVAMIDDVVDKKSDVMMGKLFTTYRNADISTILSAQSSRLFQKTSRGNVNFVFFFKINTGELMEDAIKSWLSGHLPGTKEEKMALYAELTKNYQILFLDILQDKLYVVK